MFRYSYHNIIIVNNVIIIKFLFAQFVPPGALQLSISFLTQFTKELRNFL